VEFEVNGQTYFLTFVDDERRWYVFAPTASGMQRMQVYVDGVQYENLGILGKSSYNAHR
jgi:hypothetical protein